jgi:hypothetical protein
MHQSTPCRLRAVSFALLIAALLLVPSGTNRATLAQTSPVASPAQARTPIQTVGEFYKALRERRFREAFALSIYKPALDGLSAEEYAELQPEFEKLAGAVPEKIEFGGELISGDKATVFARVGGENVPLEAITLMRGSDGRVDFRRPGGAGDRPARRQRVLSQGAHRDASQGSGSVAAEDRQCRGSYAAEHNGQFADMRVLLESKPALHEDVESAQTLGYQFQITLGKDRKSYQVNAEPLRYGRTGLLSYYADQTGMQKKDTGGKPYNPPKK